MFDLRPWRRLLPVWVPAVVVCVAAAGLYIWQSSESGGHRAQVRRDIEELEIEVARLERLESATSRDRQSVIEFDEKFGMLYREVFGSLDERLTSIMRAVGAATRSAGLLPDTYSYVAKEDPKTGFVRFGIRFTVEGEYAQIRQMLAELRASEEFLIVDNLSLTGDRDPISRELKMSVSIATLLAEADERQLRRLTGGFTDDAGNEDG